MNSSRKRSRALSLSGTGSSHHRSPLPASANGGGVGSVSSANKFILDKNERLLRLNVGGYPYDVVRTSLPLLETMMTDRWLSSALIDSDGRIFIDRDGESFGDILRYLRGGPDFLLEVVQSSNNSANGFVGNAMFSNMRHGSFSSSNSDRLRRLRIEADYYGLSELVNDIDVVTIGQKIVFTSDGWGRVSGACLSRDQQLALARQNDHGGDQLNGVDQQGQNDMQLDDIEEGHDEEEEQEGGDDDDDGLENEDADVEENNAGDLDDDDAEVEVQDDDAIPPNHVPPYKFWQWSKQSGNPDILKPHPTHTSSMVVGQDGTYLLLLRVAAALPSPLARIKWDLAEEEGRRVTRGATRRDRADDSEDENLDDIERSKELEEDCFVTVNIEAPLNTVMDSVDESQTHFPLLRTGLWDYRPEEEVTNDEPVFATLTAMDVVVLTAGDILSLSFDDEVSRERFPLCDSFPSELVNSLTLVKVHGNTLSRYERLKSSPTPVQTQPQMSSQSSLMADPSRRNSDARMSNSQSQSPRRNSRRTPDVHSYAMDQDDEDDMEDFDRDLCKIANWVSPKSDLQPTPFDPALHSDSSVLEFPQPGQYLIMSRIAIGCRRDASFLPVLSGGPLEGHKAQLSVRSAGGRTLHSVGYCVEEKPRLESADLSVISENAAFNDLVQVPTAGAELQVSTTGDCRLHPEGTEVGPFCCAVSQSLSCLLLNDEAMITDRLMVGTVRAANNRRVIKWYQTRPPSSFRGQGKGGSLSRPSLFDIEGHKLIYRGFTSESSTAKVSHVLLVGSIPPLHRGYSFGLFKNDECLALSITPETLDKKGRHGHYLQEVIELKDGDEVTIAACEVGGESDRNWRDQCHVESNEIELDTRLGYFSFVVMEDAETPN